MTGPVPTPDEVVAFVPFDVTCIECGHVETVRADGTYRTVDADAWKVNPSRSEMALTVVSRYICEPCWEALPE